MSVSRLSEMQGIGVDQTGNLVDQVVDPEMLRLENLDSSGCTAVGCFL